MRSMSENKNKAEEGKVKKLSILMKGIFRENPALCLILGLCPTLAVTVSLDNAIGMGISTLFVLVFSNMIISSLRNVIPDRVRIPSYIVIIATFVTIISLFMEAYNPDLFSRLGIYVPLIVVNCIILGRAEAFAKRNTVFDSLLDGLGMGIGFTLSLIVIGIIREVLGNAKLVIFGRTIFDLGISGMNVMLLAPGAFLVMAFLIAGMRVLNNKNISKNKEKEIKEAA